MDVNTRQLLPRQFFCNVTSSPRKMNECLLLSAIDSRFNNRPSSGGISENPPLRGRKIREVSTVLNTDNNNRQRDHTSNSLSRFPNGLLGGPHSRPGGPYPKVQSHRPLGKSPQAGEPEDPAQGIGPGRVQAGDRGAPVMVQDEQEDQALKRL